MENERPIRILLIDYHAVVRSGLAALLEKYPDFEVTGQVESASEAVFFCDRRCPDVVLFDLDGPEERNNIAFVSTIHARHAGVRIVVLTNILDEPTVYEVLHAGATSYLLKNIPPDELAYAIRMAHHGQPTLSPEVTQMVLRGLHMADHLNHSLTHREQQVLALIARGRSNKDIAQELDLSLSTVQFHVSNILSKLNVHNRVEAAALAMRERLV